MTDTEPTLPPPIRVEFLAGAREGETLELASDLSEIVFGRDPEQCQVVFPPDATAVGRVHCSLRRELDRFVVVNPGKNELLIDGAPAEADAALSGACELVLGPGGPKLRVTLPGAKRSLPKTMVQRRVDEPGHKTMVYQLRGQLRRQRVVFLLLLTCLLAGGVVAQRAFRKSLSDVAEGVEGVREGVRELEGKVSELSSEQSALLDELHGEVARLEAAADFAEELFTRHSPSVGLILAGEGDKVDVKGTGWVVGEALVATNAHVVEPYLEGQDALGWVFRVGQQDFTVTRVTVHPGYEAFEELVGRHGPLRNVWNPIDETWVEVPIQPVSMCDVALVHLAESEGLPPALPLADDEALAALDPGAPVCYLGFPMEDMVAGGANVARPIPVFQSGRLTGVTDPFLLKALDPARNLLLQHSCGATGGASGSPLFTREGDVIGLLSAVNFAFVTETVATELGLISQTHRVPLAVGVNFAQQVSMLRELIDGRADDALSGHLEVWGAALAELPSRGKSLREEIQRLMDGWRKAAPDAEPETLLDVEAELDQVSSQGFRFFSRQLELEPGHYLLAAGSTAKTLIRISLFGPEGLLVSEMNYGLPAWSNFEVEAAGRYKVIVSSDVASSGLLRLYRLP